MYPRLKLCRFALLNQTILIAADLTPMDVDYAAHAGGPQKCTTQRMMTAHLL